MEEDWSCLFGIIDLIWLLWLARNKLVFQGEVTNFTSLPFVAKSRANEMIHASVLGNALQNRYDHQPGRMVFPSFQLVKM